MSVWFDRYAMEPSSPERTESVEASCSQLEMLLDDVVASGVAPSRILIGGFSMGGGIALQTALRSKHAELPRKAPAHTPMKPDVGFDQVVGLRPSFPRPASGHRPYARKRWEDPFAGTGLYRLTSDI